MNRIVVAILRSAVCEGVPLLRRQLIAAGWVLYAGGQLSETTPERKLVRQEQFQQTTRASKPSGGAGFTGLDHCKALI